MTAAIVAAEFRMKHALFAVVGLVAGLIFNGPTHSQTLVPVEPRERTGCVYDYKLCADNDDLLNNFSLRNMSVGSICYTQARNNGHALPSYAFMPRFRLKEDRRYRSKYDGRLFVDSGIVRLTVHGLTCVIDLDAATVGVTADETADGPWCLDDYRACADDDDVYDHYYAKNIYDPEGVRISGNINDIQLDAACIAEGKRRGYQGEVSYHGDPGRSWIDTGIARFVTDDSDAWRTVCLVDLKTRLVKSYAPQYPDLWQHRKLGD
jgi:hypothetical protein